MFVSDKAKELFAHAQTMAPAERDQFVTDACYGNKKLFEEVDSLLKAAESSEAFFSKIVNRMSLSAIANNDEPLRRGKIVGHWRLGECIGRGGMGAVYLAERADKEFEKRAAVKLLPFGGDSDKARDRFLVERQILARLVHENIAQLLDGGVTDEGVPFFVMDYVEGAAIDDYCRTEQLDVNGKIRLVLQITDALQYAHANLVVHRDLKPANVLVENSGRVRLLDFGVAKLLDPSETQTELTHYAQRPVTPAFASPEMLRGDPVDVTTDVYSTGVLLHLLLTEKLPIDYNGLSVAESIAHAEQESPPPASSLSAGVGVDLDTIILKAMAKTTRDRYSSVDSLASDLRNYLAGRPVNAKEPSRFYLFKKFVQRNVAVFFTSLAASVALIGMTAYAISQSFESSRQRDLAVLEQKKTQASNEFYGLLMEQLETEPLSSVELLDRGAELLQKQYGFDEAFMGSIVVELSTRYSRIGEKLKELELLKQAESLAIKHNDRDLLASVTCRLSSRYRSLNPAKSAQYIERGKSLFKDLSDPSLEVSVVCLRMQARAAIANGDVETGLAYMFKARDALDAHPVKAVDKKGPILGYIAHIYFNNGQMEESINYLNQTLALLDSAGRGNSFGYLQVAANKAVTLSSIGRIDESLSAWENIVSRLSVDSYSQRGAALWLDQYGGTLMRVGYTDRAEKAHLKGLEAAKSAGSEEHIAMNQLGLARVAVEREDYDRALNRLQEAQQYLLREENKKRGTARSTHVLTAKIHRKREEWDQALAIINRLFDEYGYPDVDHVRGLDSTIIEATSLHHAMGNYKQAEILANDVIKRMEKRSMGDPLKSVNVGRAYVQRAMIKASSGQKAGAITDLELSIPILIERLGDAHQETRDAKTLRESL